MSENKYTIDFTKEIRFNLDNETEMLNVSSNSVPKFIPFTFALACYNSVIRARLNKNIYENFKLANVEHQLVTNPEAVVLDFTTIYILAKYIQKNNTISDNVKGLLIDHLNKEGGLSEVEIKKIRDEIKEEEKDG